MHVYVREINSRKKTSRHITSRASQPSTAPSSSGPTRSRGPRRFLASARRSGFGSRSRQQPLHSLARAKTRQNKHPCDQAVNTREETRSSLLSRSVASRRGAIDDSLTSFVGVVGILAAACRPIASGEAGEAGGQPDRRRFSYCKAFTDRKTQVKVSPRAQTCFRRFGTCAESLMHEIQVVQILYHKRRLSLDSIDGRQSMRTGRQAHGRARPTKNMR